MDEQATILAHREDENLDLGTSFEIELDDEVFSFDEEYEISFDRFITALPVTTTLMELTVSAIDGFNPTPESNRRVLEPLCRGIANLRRYNENHPLQVLNVFHLQLDEPGHLDVLEQILAAAKQGGITRLGLSSMHFCLPVQTLVEFCRDNRRLKDLDLAWVDFSGDDFSMYTTTSESIFPTLDSLTLKHIKFQNTTAAIEFGRFVLRLNVSALELNKITVCDEDRYNDHDDEDDGDDDDDNDDDSAIYSNLIISKLMKPSVERLEFSSEAYRFNHFRLALEIGTTSVIDLVVYILHDESEYLAKLHELGCMIQGSVKLKRLEIQGIPDALPSEFFQAVEANTTITEIEMIRSNPEEMQRLRKITSRNVELDRFVTSPGTYPPHKILPLMLQLNNCPTGRYLMTRCLPAVFSFEYTTSTKSPTLEPKQKKRKFEET